MTSAMMLRIKTKDGVEYDRAITLDHGFSFSGSIECLRRAGNFVRMLRAVVSPHLEITEASIFPSNTEGWVKVEIEIS